MQARLPVRHLQARTLIVLENRYEMLFHRQSQKPILTPMLVPYAISSPFNPGMTRLTILEKRTESHVKAKESQHPARLRDQEERA